MNIASVLDRNAQQFGERAAIVERGRSISFAALNHAAAGAAGVLAQAGVRTGMRALLLSPMSIDLYSTMIGMFRLGVTAVFVDPSAGPEHLDACVARVRPDAFVAVPRAHLLRMSSAAVRGIRIKMMIGGGLSGVRGLARSLAVQGTPEDVQACDADTPAIITFTTGTTGEPKAAVRTHGFLLAQHRVLTESLGLAPADVDLTTLPIFLLANLASGVVSIIPDASLKRPAALDACRLFEQLRRHRPTRTVASPALLECLVLQARAAGTPLASFRRIFTGGGPVFPVTLDAMAAVAPAAAVVAVYGSTEAEPIASIDRRDIEPSDRDAMQRGAGLLVGKPERSIQIRILPDRWGTPLPGCSPHDFDRSALGVRTAGEIVVAGEHVLTGYYEGRGNSETKIAVGDRVWHRTGDAGYLDDRGRLWLLGRCSAKVSDAEGTLYPLAVECAASAVPGVRRSAFIPHEGRRVLVVEPRTTAPAIRETLKQRLAWARIADVRLVARIPVDHRHNAKVDLPELRRLLQPD